MTTGSPRARFALLSILLVPMSILLGCGGAVGDRPDGSVGDAPMARDGDVLADTGTPTDAGTAEDALDGAADATGFDGGAIDAELIFVGDFEDPGDFTSGGVYSQFDDNIDTCEHDMTCARDSMSIVTSPVRGGARALRIELHSEDVQDTSGTRAEVQTREQYTTSLEEDYWYGFSIFVPADWEDGTDQKVVHQWHTGGTNPGGSPIIGLRIRAGAWQITREFVEGDAIELWDGGAVEKGEWTDFVLNVRWSVGATGHFTTWRNGEMVYTEAGPNMNAGTTTGEHYQKMGMYGTFSGPVTERVLYYDEVRVARGPGGYALVAPR